MKQKDIEHTLNQLGVPGTLVFVRTLTSAVTTAWGVDWDEQYIARDLMQNFFDANRDCLEEILVQKKGSDVLVRAPAPFNLDRLFYLGSEKGDDDVGQYGEGFKAAATCLLRDHEVTPIAVSGLDVVVLRVAKQKVANTQLYPVEYDFYRIDIELPGTALILPGCSGKLAKAMSEGLTHFFHDRNPLIGAKRWSDYDGRFSIFESTDNCGHVFYRKLKRGEMEGIPLVLVIDKEYQALERKISKDRDRNAFGDEVMKLFFSHFARYGLKESRQGQEVVVQAAKGCWQRGHPLLQAIADSMRYRDTWNDTLRQKVFGVRYFSRIGTPSDPNQRLEIERIERAWKNEGRFVLPGYFKMFGVLNAEGEIRRIQDKLAEESKKSNQRGPSTAEQLAIRLLSKSLKELAPEIISVFDKGTTSYTVARTEVVLGQLKSGRSYRSRDVFLAESVFVADFPSAFATFLHEHAHVFGHDGSRGFTDALTELLETVVRQRDDLDQYEASWKDVAAKVQRERVESDVNGDADSLDAWLSKMDETELRAFVGRLPPVVLKQLRPKRVER